LASRLGPPMSAGRASAGMLCLGAEARLGTTSAASCLRVRDERV
jgi:hypothetical protein